MGDMENNTNAVGEPKSESNPVINGCGSSSSNNEPCESTSSAADGQQGGNKEDMNSRLI